MKTLRMAALIASGLLAVGSAQAGLVDQGNGTVLDTQAGLVWLKDWTVNGWGSWTSQSAWAEGLTFAGSGEWVLPTLSQYSTIWAAAGGSAEGIAASFTVSPARFDTYYGPIYWTSEVVPDGVLTAMTFAMDTGTSGGPSWAYHQLHATAVREASLEEISAVPEPETYALMLAGLAVVGAAARRRSTAQTTDLR